ncbi:MAG: hypothetical protein KJO86_00895 [Muriicola sp.]|nr:hypothetical protein [Muriicola sp.]NNK10724.1 hypothetical protein [Flavobacteriaceae bacterium]
MKKLDWKKVSYIIGIVLFIVGTLDPLEGSVLIVLGSVLMTIVANRKNDRHKKWFLLNAILITVGVIFLFYLSSLGGFGGTSNLSWWWGLLILPYPVGWLLQVILLLLRAFGKK